MFHPPAFRLSRPLAAVALASCAGLSGLPAWAASQHLNGGYTVSYNFASDGYYDTVTVGDFYSFTVSNADNSNLHTLAASSDPGFSLVGDDAYFSVTLTADPGKVFSQFWAVATADDVIFNTISGGAWVTETFWLDGTQLLSDLEAGGNWGGYAGAHGHTFKTAVNTTSISFSVLKEMGAQNDAGYGGSGGVAPSFVTPGSTWFNMQVVDAPPVPEPETAALWLAGLAGLAGLKTRRRKA